jgi:hypothetical protein
MGHYASDCQESQPTEMGTDVVNDGWGKEGNSGRKAAQFMMCKSTSLQGTKEEYAYLRNSVLLDNQSVADIFCNLNYLRNVRKVSETLEVYTNGGVLTCNTKGDLTGYGTVWCHPEAIANILGLSSVMDCARYKATFDEMVGFTMKTEATTVFVRDEEGLFSAPLGQNLRTTKEKVLEKGRPYFGIRSRKF